MTVLAKRALPTVPRFDVAGGVLSGRLEREARWPFVFAEGIVSVKAVSVTPAGSGLKPQEPYNFRFVH